MTNKDLKIIKDFVLFNHTAVLSTISQSYQNFPFGSIVPYDVDQDGNLIILIAQISEHYKNLSADSRASLFIFDHFGIDDPQANSRATVLGKFSKASNEQRNKLESSYLVRFPKAVDQSIIHSFDFFMMKIEKIRWIGGFGSMNWTSAKDFTSCQNDPIAYIGMSAVKHMNQDHKDALPKYLKNFHNLEIEPSKLEMVFVCSAYFTIQIKEQNKIKRLNINFPEEIKTAERLREVMISMLKT